MRLCVSMSWNGVCVACCAFCTACNTHSNFGQVQCKLPDDGLRPKHVGAIFYVCFHVNFNVFFNLINVHLLVSELYILLLILVRQYK